MITTTWSNRGSAFGSGTMGSSAATPARGLLDRGYYAGSFGRVGSARRPEGVLRQEGQRTTGMVIRDGNRGWYPPYAAPPGGRLGRNSDEPGQAPTGRTRRLDEARRAA